MSTSSDPGPAPALSASDEVILTALQRATNKGQVRQLFQRHDVDAINTAWRQLKPVERSALLLCKHFDGTIIPEYTDDQ
jgi:hypothetical protein